MSYILDQLKQSGKKREIELRLREKAGTKTGQTTHHESDMLDKKGRPAVRPVIPATAVIAAAAALLIVFYGYGNLRNDQKKIEAAKTPPVDVRQQADATVTGLPITVDNIQKVKTAGPVEKAETARQTAAPVAPPVSSAKTVQSPASVREPVQKNETGTAAAPASQLPSGGGMNELKDLPASVRKSLPEIRIGSHIYRQDSRIVSINGKIMTEGSNIGNGLYLQEITPDGVVLSFGKYTFHIKAE